MPCKHLISTGMLVFVSIFTACSSSSSRKSQPPAAPTQPVHPEPTPLPTVTPTPAPGSQGLPWESMIGDWQSNFSDPNYFGNVTYTIQKDGQVLMSLLIYGKGKSQIVAERHTFKGTFQASPREIQLEHVKGSCAPRNAKVMLGFSVNETDPDILYLMEGRGGTYLRLSRIPGGLSQDVHTVDKLGSYSVKTGCFVEGRLNQFVPQQG
ncbi:hypothetical protein [Oligoflexus tunisiensis]|uniref:hypothetical protein n=1 Tax=Oligoflexus tunisiensis TaxID=708132 RepID=UPI00114CBB90|nr:hypothetical protein [Oligoflexus tunisiensis]